MRRETMWAMLSTAGPLGVYLSVPFCRAKCSFCNFASGVGTAEDLQRYVDLLCREIREVHTACRDYGLFVPSTVDTVYFGGGTPSLLQPAQLEQIFGALHDSFALESGAEITMEAAPGQIGDGLLETALQHGVNRVSLGVQSFVDAEASAVGRTHTEKACLQEFMRLRGAGVRDLGVDLIAGLPYQTEQSWRHSVAVATGCGLDHLSVYMLEIDHGSRLGQEVLNGGLRLHAPAVVAEEAVVQMYEYAAEALPAAGYRHYEISNFARDGRQSRHNLKYWLRRPYLGFGLDAHSMLLAPDLTAQRWANADTRATYPGAGGMAKVGSGSEREAFEESVFLGLRLRDGLGPEALERFPPSWQKEFAVRAAELEQEGLMEWVAGRWRLTLPGCLVSNEVFGAVLEEPALC